jgi:hypothetical protein
MEAKVDVRKLQVLNDRINQTIDALNQVRLSVHGLSHSGPVTPLASFAQQGVGPLGPMSSMVAPQAGCGLSHTGVGGALFGQVGWPGVAFGPGAFPGFAVQSPFAAPLGTGLLHTAGVGVSPAAVPWLGYAPGFAHSSPEAVIEQRILEARAADPFRLAQTFPCAFAPLGAGIGW